jgi:hypothetical protein
MLNNISIEGRLKTKGPREKAAVPVDRKEVEGVQ